MQLPHFYFVRDPALQQKNILLVDFRVKGTGRRWEGQRSGRPVVPALRKCHLHLICPSAVHSFFSRKHVTSAACVSTTPNAVQGRGVGCLVTSSTSGRGGAIAPRPQTPGVPWSGTAPGVWVKCPLRGCEPVRPNAVNDVRVCDFSTLLGAVVRFWGLWAEKKNHRGLGGKEKSWSGRKPSWSGRKKKS